MNLVERVADYLGFQRRADEPTSDAPTAPARSANTSYVSPDSAVKISDVYRGIQIIGTAVSQLTVKQYRGDTPIELSSLAAKPDVDLAAAHFFEENVTSLATCGNAYWRLSYSPFRDGEIVSVKQLPASEVLVEQDFNTGDVRYFYRGKQIPNREIKHLKMFRRTGYPLGLGPIQAAQIELGGTVDARNYSAQWMSNTDVPTGVLTTEQKLTPEEAKTYKSLWRGDGDTAKGHEIRVVGAGLKYEPILLKPADMQFLETRQYNKTQLATLLGIPASLLLAEIKGGTRTYQNVEQEWIAFNRFTLMAYLRPIEIALSELLPRNNTVRFNVDALLRADTLTRYKAHEIGIRSGFETVNEARVLEGRMPIAEPATQEANNVPA